MADGAGGFVSAHDRLLSARAHRDRAALRMMKAQLALIRALQRVHALKSAVALHTAQWYAAETAEHACFLARKQGSRA